MTSVHLTLSFTIHLVCGTSRRDGDFYVHPQQTGKLVLNKNPISKVNLHIEEFNLKHSLSLKKLHCNLKNLRRIDLENLTKNNS